MKPQIKLETEDIECPSCKSTKTEKQGISNWHDESGVYYMTCQCGHQWNERWYGEDYKGEKE